MDSVSQFKKSKALQAHQLFQKGKYEEALTIYKEQLEENPKDVMCLLGIADTLLVSKRNDEAKGYYEKFIEQASDKDKYVSFCNYAWCLQRLGEDKNVLDSIMSLAMKNTNDSSFQFVYQTSAQFIVMIQNEGEEMEEGEYNCCVEVLKSCIEKVDEIEPLNVQGLVMKGRIYSLIKNSKQAIHNYTQLIKQTPTDFRGYYFLGKEFVTLGFYSEAISMFITCDFFKKDHIALKDALQCAVKLGSSEKVIYIMEKKLEVSPSDSEVYDETSKAFIQLGDFDNAIMVCQKWTKDCPDEAYAWQLLGELTYQQNMYEISEEAYRNHCRLTDYQDHCSINVIGAIYLSKKDYEKCFEYCLKSLEVKHDYAFAFRNLSEFRKNYSQEKFYEFYDDYTSKYAINDAVEEYMSRIESEFPEDVEYLKKKFNEAEQNEDESYETVSTENESPEKEQECNHDILNFLNSILQNQNLFNKQ